MKKREKMLAALVLSSLMQMSACYAADYDGFMNGDYVQGTDIKFDKMDVTSTYDPQDIYIGNKDGSTQSITIGSSNLGDYNAALQINDPILTNSQGSHNVILNAENINIVGGKGVVMGGQRESDSTMLTVIGKNFTVDSKAKYGGLSAKGYGSVVIGSDKNWLDKVTIKGGQGFSAGFVGSGTAEDRVIEIYSKNVLFDSTEANKSNGTAFSNHDSNVVINADTITIQGKKTEFNNDGVVEVHGSQTDFNAKNINIIANKEKSVEKEKNKLFAIMATDGLPGPNVKTYTLNLTAAEKLNIDGNVLLDKFGTTNMVGKEVVITGTNIDTDDYEGNKGSAINLWGKSKLNLGKENAKAGSVTISSAGKFGILLGKDNNGSLDSGYGATLNGNIEGLFSVTAKAAEGCGISVQDKGFVDIKTGSMLIDANSFGLHLDSGSMKVESKNSVVINSDGVGIRGKGSGNLLKVDSGSDIVINSKKGAIYNFIKFETNLTAKNNIVIKSTDELTDDDNEKAAIYINGAKDMKPVVNLSAENGVVSIDAANRGIWASAKGGEVNITGALQIVTAKNEDKKDFALAAGGNGNNNSKIQDAGGSINVILKGDKDSFIGNDIIASDNGVITITRDANYTGKIVVEGDILAGGNKSNTIGNINIDFGQNGIFTGTANNKGFKILLDKFVAQAGVIDLTFGEGSTWKMTGDSFMNNLVANNSTIDMTADNKAFSSLHTNKFTGDGNTIKMNIDASTNEKNSDRIYVDGVHEGVHYITLDNVAADGTFDGADGTVLVSVKDEKGEFKANDSEGTLYWNKYDLAKYEEANGDEVTNGYTTDWYLKDVSKVNKPTTGVDSVLSMNSLNYHTWRTENDKLLQRMGELRHNGEEEKGAWFRVKGSKIGYDGGFENKYTTYELGYDEVTKRTDDVIRYQGAALSYVDGKSSYNSGSGDNHGKSIGFYTTEQYSKGHYLDLVFKISNMDNDFKVFDTKGNKITGEYDNTGVSISAEYGRKNDLDHGWYIEPQAQLTLGYMGGASYVTDNGISVDQSGIKSALGRIGFNIGKQIGERGIVYAKANLLHEFGGGYDVAMEAKDGSLTVSNTYNDTWFEYGVGVALATSDNSHIYFDVERSTGSDFYKDWQWNAGMRWSF